MRSQDSSCSKYHKFSSHIQLRPFMKSDILRASNFLWKKAGCFLKMCCNSQSSKLYYGVWNQFLIKQQFFKGERKKERSSIMLSGQNRKHPSDPVTTENVLLSSTSTLPQITGETMCQSLLATEGALRRRHGALNLQQQRDSKSSPCLIHQGHSKIAHWAVWHEHWKDQRWRTAAETCQTGIAKIAEIMEEISLIFAGESCVWLHRIKHWRPSLQFCLRL